MQPLGINGNQGSQAYGSDPGGAFMLDSIVNATVIEKVDKNLYLLQVGNAQIEAKVAADLQVGTEYQFVVEKNGTPPELSLLNSEPQGRLDNGLTPEENKWVLKLANAMGKSGDEISPKALLDFVRQLGFDIKQNPAEVFKTLEPILNLISRIDGANPTVRQLMGQTLMFNMHANGTNIQGISSDLWLEQVVRIAGEIPKWSEDETQALIKIKNAIQESSADAQKNLKAGLLGTQTKQNVLLEKNLIELVTPIFKKNENTQQLIQQTVQDIMNSPVKRLFLASEPHQLHGQNNLPHLEKNEAIQAFQQQAPGLASTSTTSLLEHFSNLGGRLEKLNVGDVVSSQLAWKGGTPSAMQLHRTGSVLHLVQDLPPEQRNISASALTTNTNDKALPVILDKSLVSDPSNSATAMSKLNEFSQQSSLPNSYHVDKLLQNWTQSGGALSELRPHIDSIQSWSQFIDDFPEFRHQLAEQLLKSPIFQQMLAGEVAGDGKVVATKETAAALQQALADGGHKIDHIPNKEIQHVQNVLQEIAGPDQKPSPALVSMASWMMSRGIEINANSLKSVMSFYQGHDNMKHLLQGLQDVLKNVDLPKELADTGKQMLAQLTEGGAKIKDVLGFYQKGNGANLRMWLNQVHDFAHQNNMRDFQLTQQLQFLSQRIHSQEEFLSGLKHYNIQAQRHDTPQLFELPFSFGGEVEHAFLKIFKRNKGSDVQNPENNFKVVIDLDLEGLGKVRSEVSLFNQHLQLDFISPEQAPLKALKDKSEVLNERLENNELNASLGFKLKQVDPDPFSPEPQSKTAPKEKAKIDISA